jgi:hypothetical protein
MHFETSSLQEKESHYENYNNDFKYQFQFVFCTDATITAQRRLNKTTATKDDFKYFASPIFNFPFLLSNFPFTTQTLLTTFLDSLFQIHSL